MKITVVGMGKIGLPLAVQFARKGNQVFGSDINIHTVDMINSGKEPFPGEKNLQIFLKEEVDSGRLVATLDTETAVSKSDVVIVVVPLFVDKNGVPDFGAMDNATKSIGKGLQKNTLVSYETTVPVGTTRNRFASMIEIESGLKAGIDFSLVFSPERVLTGRVFDDLRKYPKLVGGIDEKSAQKGVDFYSQVLDFDNRDDLSQANGVWNLGDLETSEMTKLAETTYRDVNIALANQFALFAESKSIDIMKVIESANSQNYSHIHKPGIAVGGHCIPIYPQMYLLNDPEASLVKEAREINLKMPSKVVEKLQSIHGNLDGQRVVVLGAAYRGGVKETAFSGVFPTVEKLKSTGASVFVHDPLFMDLELSNLGLVPYHYGDPIDAAIIQTDHEEYSQINPEHLPKIQTLIDGRGITERKNWKNVKHHILGRK